jgi:hypothetical protein
MALFGTKQERLKRKEKYEFLRAQLEVEQTSFESHWRDLANFILPRRQRFQLTDTNRGERVNRDIIDSTATFAVRTLRAGMMGGVTSPARPWFRLTTPDPGLAELDPVKDWLALVTRRMGDVFLKSNLYDSLPILYGDMAVFGTAAVMIEEDFRDVIRTYPFAIGSYFIAQNDRLQVDTFFRIFRMTVHQLVAWFGERDRDGDITNWENFSTHVKNLWDQNQRQAWIDVYHVIMPNDDYDPDRLEARFKKYVSAYYEVGGSGAGGTHLATQLSAPVESDRLLRESGYDFFPVLCPRWEITGEDIYGTDCPGMTVLGDVRALQKMHKRKAQAIDKKVNPPMIGPTHLRNQKATTLPGDITYLDVREGQQGFRPAHEVNFSITELLEDIREHQIRIRRGFYEDIFLMLASSDRRQFTATEIIERREEKLLALGSVLERINQDVLKPLIDIVFEVMLRQGMIPQPPEELQGVDLKVEFISIMAQAQKLVGIAGIERTVAFVGQIAAVRPDVLDKIDTDQLVDEYADRTGVPAGIIVSDERVAEIRAAREQARQAAAMMQAAQQAAVAAKDLSQAKTGGDEKNALTDLLEQARAGQLVETGA